MTFVGGEGLAMKRRLGLVSAAFAAAFVTAAQAADQSQVVVADLRDYASPAGVAEASIADLQAEMTAGRVTSEQLVRAYLARVAQIDRSGPTLRSVIALNPKAVEEARALDAERRAGHVRGPLHGVPILLKDNIETADPIPTTAGSLALKDNVSGRDAPLVARLRAAGAVILGKTNLSEWANIRSSRSISGWSAVGGLVKNPYALDRNACGSSSGSGAATAASLAAAAVGTETDGSITCPSAMTGLVGLKPTVGLVSRTYVVPISHSQDTAGPMGRSVADVAALLTAMAGFDPKDPATAEADAHRADYARALDTGALKGKRIGVMRPRDADPAVLAEFDRALDQLRAGGAELVDLTGQLKGQDEVGRNELVVLLTELKSDMGAYLASTPEAVKARSLDDLIAFDRAHAEQEMPLFGQDLFEQAQAMKGPDGDDYRRARETARRLAGAEGLDKVMTAGRLDAVVAPTTGPAWRTDVVDGDHDSGSASTLPAVAGYPHLTVPMGEVKGLPVGLSFIGRAWSEPQLLALGYAYEQRAHARKPPTYAPSIELDPEVQARLAPAG
jgi:amidase